LSNLLASSVVLILLLPEFKDFSFKKISFKLYVPILAYGLPLLISGLAGVINETLDRSIFKHIIKDTQEALYQLAIYGANYKLASVILIIVQMFRYAAEPFFFNYEKEQDSKERYAQVMHIFIGILIFVALIIIVYIDILKHFLGNKYFIGIDIVPVIALAYIFYGILFNLSAWFKLSNKTQYAVVITAVGAIITILINVFYIGEYGYRASAVAHVISYFVMVLISFILSRIFYPIPYNLKRIVLYFIVGGIIYYINSLVRLESIILSYFIKTILVAIFAIFVVRKEKLDKILFKK
jgi:O-antigen/teichoic acid export membrane protein